MSTITEIAEHVYRISIFDPRSDMQFNHFLINDDEPVLYHTGSKPMFAGLFDAVRQIIPPEKIRWIGFSHFEADECGAIDEWLASAPSAQVVATVTAIMVNNSSIAPGKSHPLGKSDLLQTGNYCFRMIPTPHLPHGWDAGMFFEQTHSILFCSDLFHQNGDPPPITSNSVLNQVKQALVHMQTGPMHDYIPYTANTERYLHELAVLQPRLLATQHGSTFIGDGAQALNELGLMIKELYSDK